ncbi:TPA: hypothetical protein L9366_005293 [Klebsiella pneumoniae]|nr:hypothetical protein [Klebsiella pneumoniae]
MTDITELAQRLKLEVHRAVSNFNPQMNIKTRDLKELVEALESEKRICATWRKIAESTGEKLEKAQQRNAELEAQNDYFASLVAMARVSADKAIRKFPQPNYVLLKVAEEAGEVVQAGVHYAENRMEWGQVEGEIVQLLAMLIRLVTEGDQVNGITPPALCSAGIKVEQLS